MHNGKSIYFLGCLINRIKGFSNYLITMRKVVCFIYKLYIIIHALQQKIKFHLRWSVYFLDSNYKILTKIFYDEFFIICKKLFVTLHIVFEYLILFLFKISN